MLYEVKALRGASEIISFNLDAADESDALRQATERGYTVLAARRVITWYSRGFLNRRARFPLLPFTHELLVLLGAGLPIIEALDSLAEKERAAAVRSVISQICGDLGEGKPFSAALQRHPRVFPPLYVATVRASERTGDLQEALARFASYQTRLDLVRSKIVSASIYPVLLMVVGGLVSLFLMFYVVPRFSRIYEDLGSNLPVFSVWLLRWGQWLEQYAAIVVTFIAVLAAALAYALSRSRVRLAIERRLWRVPGIGERIKVYHLARFYRMVGMLLRGGMPVIPALQMASALLHVGLRAPLTSACQSLSEGQTLSRSLDQHGLTTPVALRMLVVGERSGAMGEMMERIAVFHDDEIARWVDWFTRLFEPLLMAVIGVAIGVVVILMYLPIFELAGSIP